MAYRLVGVTRMVPASETLLTGMLGCYDTIGDPDFDMDRDETLHERSAYEFVRDQLPPEHQAELDQVDAFWRANAEAFNRDFALTHAYQDRKTAMNGWIADDKGRVPEVPRSHWWWWPIKEEGEEQ